MVGKINPVFGLPAKRIAGQIMRSREGGQYWQRPESRPLLEQHRRKCRHNQFLIGRARPMRIVRSVSPRA